MKGEDEVVLTFIAHGTPVPQGSHRAFRRGERIVVTHVNGSKLTAWRDTVRKAALEEARSAGWEVANQPVGVRMQFRMPRPKKPRFSVPAVRPDLDKLMRAVMDALTDGPQPGVIQDDSLMVSVHATEVYHADPGVLVTVYPISQEKQEGGDSSLWCCQE